MKKNICYLICIVIITLLVSNIFVNYCLNNVYIGTSVTAQEREYPEFTNKIMGFGGVVRNKTIFPIRVKELTPIGDRGMEYVTTLISPWGFSEIKQNEIDNYENLEKKVISPLKEHEIGIFFKFNGNYVVNPDVYEIKYSVLGINFKKVINTH